MKHVNVALFVVHEGCPNMCSFCNQRSISGESGRVTAADVDKAAEVALASLGEEASSGEIAFFGGSFTMIERGHMLELLAAAKKYIDNGSFAGVRVSTRPDGINHEICALLKEYGVTAVELGAQSMDDGVLLKNRRGHTAADVERASALLHSFGFELGLQMMTGLYGSSDEDSVNTAKKFISLSPATVRIYPTVVLEGTELARLYRAGEYEPQTAEQAIPLCARLLRMFDQADIKVIRLGLHSGGDVESGFVAGAYHPALRERCESRVYREIILEKLKNAAIAGGGFTALVNKSEVSKVIGQKRENILFFEREGYSCRVQPVDFLKKYEVEVFR